MQWVAPAEKDTATNTLERRLWDAADQLRANSGLTSAQYSTPVLGLIFLRFADVRFAEVRAGLEKIVSSSRRGSMARSRLCQWVVSPTTRCILAVSSSVMATAAQNSRMAIRFLPV